MKKTVLLIICLLLMISASAQEADEAGLGKTQHKHQLKFGTSLQYDFTSWFPYNEYDDYYYGYDVNYNRAVRLDNYDGPNTMVFIAYEHLWAFPNKMALGIEPKIGFAFREYQSNGSIGVNWKSYWLEKNGFRMGLQLYTGYEYSQIKRPAYISHGMYTQRIERKLNQHVFSLDLGFIPVQYTFKNGVLLEFNLSLIGLHVFRIKSDEYESMNGEAIKVEYSEVGGYATKIAFKIGYQF